MRVVNCDLIIEDFFYSMCQENRFDIFPKFQSLPNLNLINLSNLSMIRFFHFFRISFFFLLVIRFLQNLTQDSRIIVYSTYMQYLSESNRIKKWLYFSNVTYLRRKKKNRPAKILRKKRSGGDVYGD